MTDWHGELTRDVRNIYAVYPRATHVAPAVRAFVEFLRHYIGSPPYWDLGGKPNIEGFAKPSPRALAQVSVRRASPLPRGHRSRVVRILA